jgi:hypothetical protein
MPGKKRFPGVGRNWTDSGPFMRDRWLDYQRLALELLTATLGSLCTAHDFAV